MNSRQNDIKEMGSLVGRHLSHYWKQSLVLVMLSVSAALLTSLQPILLAPALDVSMSSFESPATKISEISLNNIGATLLALFSIHVSKNTTALILAIVTLFLIVGIVAAVVDFAAHMLSSWINIHANCDLQFDLYKHLLTLDLKFYLRNRANELTSRFINDTGEVTVSIDVSMRQALESIILIIIYGYLLFQTSSSLAMAVVAVSLVHFLINRILKNRIQHSTSDKFDKLADTGNVLNEAFSNMRLIKCFSAEDQEKIRFRRILDLLQRISMRFSLYKHTETPLRKITDSFALGLILILAFQSLQSKELTTSGFLMFMIVVRQTIAPVSTLAQSLIRLYGGLGSAKRILEILETRSDQKQGSRELTDFKESIQFNNVTFGYEQQHPVLKNINFKLKRGEILAVVGPSGAGKSTLADLLVRLFDPQYGQVLIDGVPVDQYSIKSYRRIFGVVPQENLLNHLTVAENIAFGGNKVVPEKLKYAAKIANASEFILHLPEKYETQIGDRGVRLSGGQRQRIAIARAVYVNPKVLVLDEATSALDSESERAVQIAINKILENSTAFIIAHRLSTIRHADRILVMNNGEIEAIGSAEDLMRTSPTYRKLYNLHFDMEKNA